MIKPLSLRDLILPNSIPKPREWHLQQILKYQKAQAELERVCKEQGIPIPVMVC